MQTVHDLASFTHQSKQFAVAIGNFDGMHCGHQAIITQLQAIAKRDNIPIAVIVFEPQPQEYFASENIPARLTCLREKEIELACLNIDILVCLKFNQQLANLSATEFVQKILVDHLHVKHLLVGNDFRFGKNREGDYKLLEKLGQRFNFSLYRAQTEMLHGDKVSSTRVRQALKDANFVLAQQLLGRRYSISGRVIDGDKRGRVLGFPTANIALDRLCSPLFGIYISQVYFAPTHGQHGSSYHAVTSIGTRPMFDGIKTCMETHMLDFNQSIYGQYIQVEFLQKLRAEKKYPDIDSLLEAIKTDIANVRKYFAIEHSEDDQMRVQP